MRVKEKKDSIILNDKVSILYNHKENKELEQTIFTIKNISNDNKINQIIIDFYKNDIDYSISVYSKENNTVNKTKLSLYKCSNEPIFPIYKYLNLELNDGDEKEFNEYTGLNEDEVLEEIFFIIYYGNYFQEKEILRSFNIITPLLKDLINDFMNFKSKNLLWNNKKLVKK